MKHINSFFLLLVLLMSVSCGVQQRGSVVKNEELDLITPWTSKYFDWTCEQRGAYLVFQKKAIPTLVEPLPFLHIVVVDLDAQCEVYSADVMNASLEWVDNYIFKVVYPPGNREAEKDCFFYYNIETRKRMDRISPHKM